MRAGQWQPQPGKASAWTALTLGITISVAANVANSWYGSPRQLAAWTAAGHHGPWHPSAGAVLGAAYFRVKWPAGIWWSIIRYCGTGIVALVAAFISYLHMSELLARYGYSPWPGHVGPLSVDGLMLVAAVALMTFVKPADTTQNPLPPARRAEGNTPATANGALLAGHDRAWRDDKARALLASNCRLTNGELAAELGVSPSTSGRIKRRILNGSV